MTHGRATNYFIHIAFYGCGGFFSQFYDTVYVKITDNIFHISPTIPTYYTSNCMHFDKRSIYVQHYYIQGKKGTDKINIRLSK